MNKDLRIIKKKYGENMSKLCRELFPQLLETEGLLSNLILSNFNPSHQLYNDIISENLTTHFKNYIYGLINMEIIYNHNTGKTPKELLDEAGYNLYECTTEEEIQNFKKYYAPGEILCTFRGGRLNRCRVFFAVKKDVDEIRREAFFNPDREDQYGISVISIQFTKDDANTLSIKNRYNSQVKNADATFKNNLDNIINGLTSAFEQEYGIVQHKVKNKFEIPNYIKANDGKYYKYNYHINGKYYCPNNIVIDNLEVKRLEKEKYVLLDYFILDLQNKKITVYDESIKDSFIMSIGEIEKVEVINKGEEKEINITPKKGEVIRIVLDQENKLIRLKNNNIEELGDWFLKYNTTLEEIELEGVEIIGDYFLYSNTVLKKLYAHNLKTVKKSFLCSNTELTEIELDNLEEVGDFFLFDNAKLIRFSAKKLKVIGKWFFDSNTELEVKRLVLN